VREEKDQGGKMIFICFTVFFVIDTLLVATEAINYHSWLYFPGAGFYLLFKRLKNK